MLTIAVPAKTSDNIPWLRGYDYGGIGSVVNYMFIMAYDWHHAGSEPGPVAPITEIRRTIEFTIAQVPSRKSLLSPALRVRLDHPVPAGHSCFSDFKSKCNRKSDEVPSPDTIFSRISITVFPVQ